MRKSFWLVLVAAMSTTSAAALAESAESLIAPAAKRFATADAQEVPDFRRHVMPLLGRLGCNGRACHGSFQGQGGFRLSLFGYDAKLDHEGLFERIDVDNPEGSYALQKPTLQEPHRGGKRLDKGGWEYNVIVSWIKGGAKVADENGPKLTAVEVSPKEIVFGKDGEHTKLKVVGVWSDGTREDVTCLSRFQSNDEQVAEVTKDGRIESRQSGDTHVVVTYDNSVVPVPVIRPVSDQVGDKYPLIAARTKVDELVIQKLKKLGIVPSEVASDTEFLRRVSLDLSGTLPAPQEIENFMADTSSDKRAKKIDELMERPAYAAWWATRLCDWTGNTNNQANFTGISRDQMPREWYDWVRIRLEKNVPYDEIAAGFVMGNSRNKDENYREYCEKLSTALYDKQKQKEPGASERDSVPYYWTRGNFRTAEDRVVGFAYNFLGIRIQCAQCHKHPFDQWTQDDFHQFKNFFVHTRTNNNPESRDEAKAMLEELGVETKSRNGNDLRRELQQLAQKGKVIPIEEVWTAKVQAAPSRGRRDSGNNRNAQASGTASAKLLGSPEAIDLSQFEDPRQPLMDWLRSKENKLFARAFVNRVWSNYFNVGIVQPPDDHNLANPPSNAALLDYLAAQFIAHDFDIKWLHREICNSDTYQRTWTPNATNAADARNFSHAIPRRLPAEVAYDAISTATGSDEEFAAMHTSLSGRAIAVPGAGGRGNRANESYALTIFGRSVRESNCDCDRSSDASLLQTVFLQNDQEVLNLINRSKGGWLNQAGRELGLVKDRRPESRDDKSDTLAKDIERFEVQLERARKKKDEKQIAYAERKLAELQKDLDEQRAKASDSDSEKPTASSGERLQTVVNSAYLRTLSRYPTEDELTRSVAYIQSSDDTLRAVGDVMWALLNTKEFIVNH